MTTRQQARLTIVTRASAWFGPAGGRQLVAATLASSVGSGVFASTSVFYLVGRGASLRDVGVYMTGAGIVAILLSPVIADQLCRLRPGQGLVALHLARALIFLSLPYIPERASLIAVAVAIVFDKASAPVLQTFVTLTAPAAERMKVLGHRRAAANLGLGAGTAVGGLLLLTPHRLLVLAPLLNSLSFVFAAWMVWRLSRWVVSRPATGARPAVTQRRTVADRLGLVALTASLNLYDILLTFGVPAVVLSRHLPSWWSPALLGLSFLLVTSLMVPSTRVVERRMPTDVSLGGVGGILIGSGCLAIASTQLSHNRLLSMVGLAAAVVLWSSAELAVTNLLWRLPLTAAEHDRGRLIAQLSVGSNAATACAPFALASAIVPGGAAGWISLAGLMAISSVACRSLGPGGANND